MNKKMKTALIIIPAVLIAAAVVYCTAFGSTPISFINNSEELNELIDVAGMLSEKARSGSGNAITLSDSGITAASTGVTVSGNSVTIGASGTYTLTGTLSEGSINVGSNGNVTLILDGANITNSSGNAINAEKADHVQIYLKEGTENSVTSGKETEIISADENDEVKDASGAAIYSKSDISVSGDGSLNIFGYINNGIASADNLAVLSGNITVEAVNNGIKANDSVTVEGGSITVKSGNDGIKSENDSDTALGNVYINGGNIKINSFGDGIQAINELNITDGVIDITTGSGASESRMLSQEFDKMGDMPFGFGQNNENTVSADESETNSDNSESIPRMTEGEQPADFDGLMPEGIPPAGVDGRLPQMPGEDGNLRQGRGEMNGKSGFRSGNGEYESGDSKGATAENSSSGTAGSKALKSDGQLTVSGGEIKLSSSDDALHSNGSMIISGGSLSVEATDDAIHADESLTVSGGEINITKSHEGIEAYLIEIKGGNIKVNADDDGINAGGSSDIADMAELVVSDGNVYINSAGDGLDSNGNLYINGGNIIVEGSTNNGNGALDSGSENGGEVTVNGGTIIAIGASGMAETFSGSSSQCSVSVTTETTNQAGTVISIKDNNGNEIYSFTSTKSFNSVVFSSNDLVLGENCTVTVGDKDYTVELNDISNGDSGSQFAGAGGFGRGNRTGANGSAADNESSSQV
ncbi:MAG: carbohydrate-binding domain-containing protein [Clostridia bacterium]|nr:carbohydrate-binding domain-containing protein [Clostridia bacterium]